MNAGDKTNFVLSASVFHFRNTYVPKGCLSICLDVITNNRLVITEDVVTSLYPNISVYYVGTLHKVNECHSYWSL